MFPTLILAFAFVIAAIACYRFVQRRHGWPRVGCAARDRHACAARHPVTARRRICGAARFDGIDDGLEVPVPAEQNWGPGQSFSVECRFRAAGRIRRRPAQVLIGRDEWARATGSGLHWWLGLWGKRADHPGMAGKAACVLRDCEGNSVALSGRRRLDDRRWHRLLAHYDAAADRISLYVDGRLEGSESARFPAGFASAISPFNVGWLNHAMHGGKNNYYRFHGELDWARVGSKECAAVVTTADTSASTTP